MAKLLGTTAAFVVTVAVSACRGVPNALGPDSRTARANADALFGALAVRFQDVQRAPKFAQARAKLGRYALSPSGVFGDTSVWTSAGTDSSRTLTLAGTRTATGYAFTPRAMVPIPSVAGDSRHVIRLRKRGDSEYEWFTGVDHAIGTVRAADVANATRAFFGAPEGKSEEAVRADYRALFPRTTNALGELFVLETVRLTPLPDRSTSVLLRYRMHLDGVRKTRPNFAKYLEKYVEPARYRVTLGDGRGTTWLEAGADDAVFSVTYRSRGGALLSLAETTPARPMPDSLQISVDFSAKFMVFRVGVSRLIGDFITVRSANERGWSMRFRREPDWHFPLAVNHLIRTSLRHPFSGEGINVRVVVRDAPATTSAPPAQTMLARQASLSVQESGIVRWLGGLGNSAMSDFAGRAEAEENRYLFEVLSALREDFVAAVPGAE